ncbi:response regulator [Derxia lacustris]|uniref:response regulator n=1 Tax=Derxia lacustris TaxID=764842 RepID=UPI000A16EA33|nr:response regulator [Derxia lacustris]
MSNPASRSALARVLVVEDNPINRELAHAQLESFGCDVETAENGQVALDRLAETGFDVVFMDMQMPVLDGLATIRLLRAREAGAATHQRVIALTANTFQSDIDTCLAAGFDGFIGKPCSIEDMRRVVETAIGAR